MKSWTRFAVVLMASTMGCGSEAMGTDEEMSGEGDVASAEQALWEDGVFTWQNGPDGWQNGPDGWQNGPDGWQNGPDGWQNGREGWLVGDNAYSQVSTDGVATGYEIAYTNAYGNVWTNGWNYAGMASFAWADQQSCAHPLSQPGGALVNGCNSMVNRICAVDPYCCTYSWDAYCVNEATSFTGPRGTELGCFDTSGDTGEVPTYLGAGMTVAQCAYEAQMKGFTLAQMDGGGYCRGRNTTPATPAPPSSCYTQCYADIGVKCGAPGGFVNIWQVPSAHPVTQTGNALASSHSDCAAAVIAADAHCGTTTWDAACVKKAAQICTERYITRPRFEDGRNMVDVCAEVKEQGYPACSFAGKGANARECCRRALVLNGVYFRVNTATKGTNAEWRGSRTVNLPGSSQTASATIIADPCVTDFKGNVVCQNEPHFWQAAGPNGTVYPDCSGSNGPRPCNRANANQMVQPIVSNGATVIKDEPYRGILVGVMSALVTTTGHYTIDIRSQESLPPLPFHPDPGGFEAEWAWTVNNSASITGKAVCKNPNSTLRAGLLTGIPNCYLMEFDPPSNYIQSTFHSGGDM